MATYLIKRLLQGIVVLLAVSFVCFIMFRYTGDPVLMLAGKYATQQEREMVRVSYGLDRPIYVQYVSFIGGALKGNFGKSYISSVDALDMILERMPATLELAFTAICISFILGVGLGVVVSVWPTGLISPGDHGRIDFRHFHPHISDRYPAGDGVFGLHGGAALLRPW
jgi:ABC-type dipeptide/oligopeptide/nickel transport system permease component